MSPAVLRQSTWLVWTQVASGRLLVSAYTDYLVTKTKGKKSSPLVTVPNNKKLRNCARNRLIFLAFGSFFLPLTLMGPLCCEDLSREQSKNIKRKNQWHAESWPTALSHRICARSSGTRVYCSMWWQPPQVAACLKWIKIKWNLKIHFSVALAIFQVFDSHGAGGYWAERT